MFGTKPKPACVTGIVVEAAKGRCYDSPPHRERRRGVCAPSNRRCRDLHPAGSTSDDARSVALRVLAALKPIVPDPAPIKEGGGNRDRSYVTSHLNESFAVPFQSGHTDGFAYGDNYPDYIFLLCVRPAAAGGESFVVDTYGLLETLAASRLPGDAELSELLCTAAVEQTEPGFFASLAPAVGDNGRGRRMARWTPVQRPDANLPPADQERHRTMLARWSELTHAASLAAPRFALGAGDALCIDNYRMLHCARPRREAADR